MSTTPRERPIPLHDSIVCDILSGATTTICIPSLRNPPCPLGGPGDLLWIQEAHRVTLCGDIPVIDYRATCETDDPCGHPITFEQFEEIEQRDVDRAIWRPAISMPRWASRITLEIASTREEWIYDPKGPWIWVIDFERIRAVVDAELGDEDA